jgi:hypothetical protein
MFGTRVAAIAFGLLLTPFGCEVKTKNQGTENPKLADRDAVSRCLPDGHTLDEKFREGGYHGKITTIEKKLAELGTHIRNGKIFDRNGKRIFFFKGFHYAGYPRDIEMEDEVDQRLKDLQKKGTVIQMWPLTTPK